MPESFPLQMFPETYGRASGTANHRMVACRRQPLSAMAHEKIFLSYGSQEMLPCNRQCSNVFCSYAQGPGSTQTIESLWIGLLNHAQELQVKTKPQTKTQALGHFDACRIAMRRPV